MYIYNTNYSGRKYILLYIELKELIILFIKLLKDNKIIKNILNKYNNNDIKNKINKIYKIILFHLKYLINIIDKLIKIIKLNLYNNYINIIYYDITNDISIDNENDIVKKVIFNCNKINFIIENIGVRLTDLYFIKKFLDSSSIDNAILYTGMYHVCNISYLLIKYFKFKITHITFIKESIDINKYILKLPFNNYEQMNKLLTLITKEFNNDQIYQCTNLFNFPDNFT